jgi:hypothetical protein
MAVFKSSVEVHDAGDRPIGTGTTYVHLRLAADAEQRATGTVSLKRWAPEGEAPAWLALADGRSLPIEVSREVLSECSRNHILRYQASWPPVPGRVAPPSGTPTHADPLAESARER